MIISVKRKKGIEVWVGGGMCLVCKLVGRDF